MKKAEDPQRKRPAPPSATEKAGEEHEDESQRQCLVCGEVPESIICLACNHSVDIPCAAKIILQDQQFKDIDISQIKCLLCGEVTHLSEEVQATLVKYLQSEEVEFDMGEEEAEDEGAVEEGQEEEDKGEEEEVEDEKHLEEEKPLPHVSSKGNKKTGQLQGNKPSKVTPKNAVVSHNASRDRPGSSLNTNDLSFHFACTEHPNEEYAYYSATTRKLYCAQCLLKEGSIPRPQDLKSIKRSLQ